MNVPSKILIQTKEYIEIVTKVNLYIALYGCEPLRQYLESFPLKWVKLNGRNAGAYIVNKVCEEYQITQYDLFESTARLELSEARQVLCFLLEKHLEYNQVQISSYFNRSRHFAKRNINSFSKILQENHPIDHKVIARFKKLDLLISAYMAFEPKTK